MIAPFVVRSVLHWRPRFLPPYIANPLIGFTTTDDGGWQ